MELLATCAFGLEKIVVRELATLGYAARILGSGRILFEGDESAICRANLWLRTADRVLVRMAHFTAADFDTLFETTRSIDWSQWLPSDAEFPVTGRSMGSQLTSVPACQRAVKKAVVESLFASHNVSLLNETGALYKIDVALLKDEVTLTIDTSGPSLHKRGYRTRSATAPLKETLAAAMIQLSYWRHDRPLIDPFCGSGTIPIEAAMIGRNLAPGRFRRFAAEDWPNLSAGAWEEARREADDLARPDMPERLIGTDIDSKVLELARYHAEQAGVAEQVHFQHRAFDQLLSKRQYGCVITNPPYGIRLEEQCDVEALYQSMPEVLQRLPTWSHYILTAYPNFERLIQKQADRRRKLYNARIECTLYQFYGPKPHQQKPAGPSGDTASGDTASDNTAFGDSDNTAAGDTESDNAASGEIATVRDDAGKRPAFGGRSARSERQAQLFGQRLVKRARHLRRWPTRRGITCYRLYERDIPEVPLIVDRYDDHLHIAEYERPHDRDLAEHAGWLELMAQTAGEVLGIDRQRIFLKRRRRQRGDLQHERVAQQQYEITVQEAGLNFLVNLSDYVDTGLFLDHRVTRGLVRDDAQGTTFLNLFGYTGAFSVYAAAGGAVRTTTVDLSANYLKWAARNLAINGFTDNRHRIIRSDAQDYLAQLQPEQLYDLAVVDPPTFSNSKRTDDDWEIQRDHASLLNRLLNFMKPSGIIYFSTNFRRFKMDEQGIADCRINEISRRTVPEDYRNQRIHRCWRIVKNN